jgi:type I restriction enzyme S subunit
MSEWQEFRMDEIALIVDCEHKTAPLVDNSNFYSVRTSNISNGKIDFEKCNRVSQETYQEWTKREVPTSGDLVLAREAPVGEIGLIKTGYNVCLGQRTVLIRVVNPLIYNIYLLYYLVNPNNKNELIEMSGGSVVSHLNMKDIRSYTIRVPNIVEQSAIASILSSLDDKVDLLQRQNNTLEKMAETLFRQWFVEEAKEEWKNGKVSDLIKIQSGFAFKSTSFVESGKYRLITIKGVQDGYLELNNADKIEELPDRMPDFCKLQIGDVLLSLTGNVGRCCVVDTNDLLLNQRVAKLHPIYERDRAFSYFLFRQPQIKQLLEEMGKGTAQSNLSPIETSNMELQIPDEDKLNEFSAIATPWLNKLLFNKKSIQTLSQLRDSLLPKLMNGEVTVEI